MPELTEINSTKPEEENEALNSGTDSEDDNDSIPELEETDNTGEKATGDTDVAAALNEEMVSKAKQSRGEKKARKIMSKLGLKQVVDALFMMLGMLLNR